MHVGGQDISKTGGLNDAAFEVEYRHELQKAGSKAH